MDIWGKVLVVCGASVKTYLRKGIKCNSEEEGEKSEKQKRSEEEEEAFHGGADMPCSSWRTHPRAEKSHKKDQ